jgi:hypothetical protein
MDTTSAVRPGEFGCTRKSNIQFCGAMTYLCMYTFYPAQVLINYTDLGVDVYAIYSGLSLL